MFRLHETTRRRVCRMAFVALCALPTLATAAWIGHWHRPWRVRDAESQLSGQLRSDVRLADWRAPRPTTNVTSSIKISDGSGHLLLEATDVRFNRVGNARAISIERATIDSRRLPEAIERASRWFSADSAGHVRLSVDELVFEQGPADAVLVVRQVELATERQADGAWRVKSLAQGDDGADESRVVRVECELRHFDSTRAAAATVDATTFALPSWLLSSAAAPFGGLGKSATFRGTIRIALRGDEVEGVAQGEIRDVNLAAALPPNSPRRAEGMAHAAVGELRWRGEQIEQLTASIRADAVHVNRSLLDGAREYLHFGQVGVGPTTPGGGEELIEVDALALRFNYSRHGLSIGGDFPADANLPLGCLAARGGTPLLMQPQYLLTTGHWIHFLTGAAGATIPATQEAVDVARGLPLPDSEPATK